jgi:hypothetical protein
MEVVSKIDIMKEVLNKIGSFRDFTKIYTWSYTSKNSHSIETIYLWMVTSVVGQTFVLIFCRSFL